MLRRELDAGFRESGWLVRRHYFYAGKLEAGAPFTRRQYRRLVAAQADEPVLVMRDERSERQWWIYRGAFYCENEGLQALEVKALVLEREAKRRRKLDRAIAYLEQGEQATSPSRTQIPDDVKLFVWQRDGGRCVGCGSNQRLEFDHVIPLALGGANTARNLQVLCEDCNRAKGASIA